MRMGVIGHHGLLGAALTHHLEQVRVQENTLAPGSKTVVIDDTPKVDMAAIAATFTDTTFTFHAPKPPGGPNPSTFYKGLPRYNRKRK